MEFRHSARQKAAVSRSVSRHPLTPSPLHPFSRCALVLLLALFCSPATRAAGIYVDASGGRHGWKVNEAHTLLWEEKPYLPVGEVITAASLAPEPPAGAWEADRAALERVRASGDTDVLVRAPASLTAAPATALQRLVDALEHSGLRYGLSLEARPAAPIDAYAAEPVPLPVPAPEVAPGASSRWSVKLPGAHHALWALVEQADGMPIQAGRVAVEDGVATVAVSFPPGNRIFGPKPALLVVVPERTLAADAAGGPLNLWAGFAEFRQSLIAGLKPVRWGPGLRFLLNPLPRGLGLEAEDGGAVPSAPEFIAEFQEWLGRHYSANDLRDSWAFTSRPVESIEIAARLVPLWRRGEGEKMGWFVDPRASQIYRIDPRRSRFWTDLARFRADSARAAVSRLAEAIKTEVVDVPVLYEWTRYHSVYEQPQGSQGADGMGLVGTGRAETLITAQAGPFAAQCEEAPRDVWAVVTSWRPLATNAMDALAPPHPAADAFQQLRSLGLKGFFVESEPVEAGGTADAGAVGAILQQARAWSADPAAASYRPAVCYFPAASPSGATVKQLAGGVWWLPSISPGETLFLGEAVRGYHIDRAFSNKVSTLENADLLWSAQGPQRVTFALPKGTVLEMFDLQGQPQKLNMRGQKLTLQLDETPVVLRGARPGSVFPVEAATEAMAEFEALIRRAEEQRMDSSTVASFKLALHDAQSVFTPATALTVYALVRPPIAVLREALSPYIWIEGERAVEQNFTGVAPDPRASGGSLLLLSTRRPPTGSAYRARYAFNVTADALYDLWISAFAPGGLAATGLQWQLDEDPPASSGSPAPVGKPYGPALSWMRLGQMRLRPGRHNLTLLVPAQTGAGEAHYQLGIDALVLAREPFQPDGTNPPRWSARSARK